MSFDNAPSRLRDLLDPITRKIGMGGAVEAGSLWRRWRGIVGDDLAGHAEPSSLKNGVLRIRTDSPVWATEIGYLAGEIKARVNADLGNEVVREVVVWTGPGPIRAAAQSDARPSGTETVGDRERAKDPAEALRRARSAWARRRSGNGRERGANNV